MHAGLCIQILSPAPGQHVARDTELSIQVLVTLACGCPSGAGGRFDFRRFELRGSLALPGGEVRGVTLVPRSTGIFAGRLQVAAPGKWRITIEAYDPESGLAGRAGLDFQVG